MFVSKHVLFGVIFSVCIFFIFPNISPLFLIIFFFSSVLIDVDHYLYYAFVKRDFSLKRAYRWYMQRWEKVKNLPKEKQRSIYSGFFLFHGIEWIILFFLMGAYISPIFTPISLGFLFHLCLDIPHEIYIKGTINKISVLYGYYNLRRFNN